ncbi:MAG: acetate/propionate family kinase [Gaiellaceae bacterium]
MDDILVVNAGSTSLKLALVAEDESTTVLDSLDQVNPEALAAVAHRVVHGGLRFREPVLIDEGVRAEIEGLESIAPLHNAPALAGIEAATRALSGVPQVAVFDTAFHATIPAEAATYALPERWRDEWGIRRYGFHGLSVAWSTERSAVLLERDVAELRLVICHLGGGCSVTAVEGGRSLDTTMGFSPLEGIPMTTRSGSVDPGALVYLLRERGLDVNALDHGLNLDSGLRALAGREGMHEIEEAIGAGDRRAEFALAIFVHRLAGAVAAMAAAAGGLDALVFTAGIGENSGLVRERACARLSFLGVELDGFLNAEASPDCDVAGPGSAARVLVLRAREELIAAREARRLLDSLQSFGITSP